MSEPQSLGSVPICVAVDKSGSTYGVTLETEIAVVQEICRLRSPTSKYPVRLLPWCDEALDPIDLPEGTPAMRNLIGSGGTNPSVLYSSAASLQALQGCGIWFLLTDGQIQDSLVEDFALKTAKVGLHNKACIIIVFDRSTSGPPSDCNISVGIAAYAVVPDCLFLFHDIPTGGVRIMQAKGRFKELLHVPMMNREHVQPVINKYTTWAELPRISYEDLSHIQLPSVRALGEQELALPTGIVVTLPDLLSGKADPETLEKIANDEDNLKSVVLASMTRGTGKDLEAWLLSQQEPMPSISRNRRDIGGRAQQAITRLVEALRNNTEESELCQLRALLKSAHDQNRLDFKKTRVSENSRYRDVRQKNNRIRNAKWITDKKRYNIWDNGMWGHGMDDPDDEDRMLREQHDDSNQIDPVFLPGFQRREPGDEFAGSCMLCQQTSVLVILLKSPPSIATANFPRPGSYSKLAFPLAMCNFAEMDIISFFVCCDACAYYLVRDGASPYAETITGALCLVSIAANKGPWLEALETAFKGRFDIPDLMTVCIATFDRMLVENKSRNASANDKALFRDCIQWATRSLANIAEVPTTLSPSFGSSHEQLGLIRLSELLFRRGLADPGQIEDTDIFLLRYPVPGFVVLLRLLQDQGIMEEQLQTVLFQRLLFHVMEVFFGNFGRGASVALAAAKSPIDNILNPHRTRQADGLHVSVKEDVVVSIPLVELVEHDLLDAGNLSSFKSIAGFEDMERQTRPAMAVFLHHLSRYCGVYASPVACFNALKASTSMRKVILTPLGISEGLSADLISQL